MQVDPTTSAGITQKLDQALSFDQFLTKETETWNFSAEVLRANGS